MQNKKNSRNVGLTSSSGQAASETESIESRQAAYEWPRSILSSMHDICIARIYLRTASSMCFMLVNSCLVHKRVVNVMTYGRYDARAGDINDMEIRQS
jgi:hypothetical protein